MELNKTGVRDGVSVWPKDRQPSFFCRTKAAEDQSAHRVEVRSVRTSGKGAIFSLPSHSFGRVSRGLSLSPTLSTVLFLKEKYHLNAV